MAKDKPGISKKEFDVIFKRFVKSCGGSEEAADELGVTYAFIQNILICKELPSKKICERLGYKPLKEIRYRYELIRKKKK